MKYKYEKGKGSGKEWMRGKSEKTKEMKKQKKAKN